jgi:hypothetical protein
MRWLAMFGALLIGGPASAAEVARQYSADMVMEAEGQTVTMRVYADEGKARSEMEVPGMGQRVVTIVRPDLQRVYILYPGDQVYDEKPLNPQDVQLSAASAPGASTQDLGTETVNGQPCTKYLVTYEGQSMWVWAAQADGIPLKMQSVEGSTAIEFRNARVGPQPASLFEIPAGYRKGTGMAGMSGLLKRIAPGLDLPLPGPAGAGDPDDPAASDAIPPELMEQMQKLMNR